MHPQNPPPWLANSLVGIWLFPSDLFPDKTTGYLKHSPCSAGKSVREHNTRERTYPDKDQERKGAVI